MDELLEQFLIEGRDLVAQAEADLGRLTRDTGDMRALDGAFRAVHTLKGSVGLFDMAPAERLLHRAEDLLSAARKAGVAPSPDVIDQLLACVDQTDRWIDQLERDGRIGKDAEERAAQLMARLTGGQASIVPDDADAAAPDWLIGFREHAGGILDRATRPLVAFRYTPDADCFFRGDDPLAIVSAVPDLEHLAILPRDDWPSLDAWDPFRCHVVVEGVSTAPLETVRAAFRLVPDQVSLTAIEPVESGESIEFQSGVETGRMLRIDGARLDALASEVGELVVAANGLAHAARLAERIDADFARTLRAVQADIDRIAGRLHAGVAQVRLVSLAPTLRRIPRLVREIAASVGKPVDFKMRGEATEVDKQIADSLFEPLLHMVRNALDHGIEDPVERKAAGKAEAGRLIVEASRQGDEVVLAVIDDGRGIDPIAIRTLAVSRGVATQQAADALSDSQALRLILAPGFSTAQKVTDISGRGVGMDAVQAAVERQRGRIVIESELGKGSRIALHLPLAAITTRLLIVRSGADRYGVPLDQIVETTRIAESEIRPVGRGLACVLRDRTVPVLDLAHMLGGEAIVAPAARLVVTKSGGEPVAIRVDGFDTRIDALVRERSGLLGEIPGVAGTTLLGDGGVLLVLNLPELVA